MKLKNYHLFLFLFTGIKPKCFFYMDIKYWKRRLGASWENNLFDF